MKQHDNFSLAFKNLMSNFYRSFLTLFLLIILLTTTTYLSIFIFSAKKSLDSIYLESLEGPITLYLHYQDQDGRSITIPTEEIRKFIKNSQEVLEIEDCSFSREATIIELASTDEYIYLDSIPFDTNTMKILDGEVPNEYDIDSNNIWLSIDIAQTLNLHIEDDIDIIINGENFTFKIKGITESDNFVDLKFLSISSVHITDNTHADLRLNYYKKLQSVRKDMSKQSIIGGEPLGSYEYNYKKYYLILGILSFLMLICLVFSMSTIIESIKISISNNYQLIGVMTALGMKDKDILKYVLYQIGIILIIAAFISTFIAVLLAKQFFFYPLSILFSTEKILIEYNTSISLINFIILAAVLTVYSNISIKRFLNKDFNDIFARIEN